MTALEEDISKWDGKSTDGLVRVHLAHFRTTDYVACLLECLDRATLRNGATWLLKKHLEDGGVLSRGEFRTFARSLKQLDSWEAQLHVLQCLPYVQVETRYKQMVESFLTDCVSSKNKFVRAWAYNGFYLLARQYVEYQPNVTRMLESAIQTEAPSVKARVRKCIAMGFA